MTYLDSALDVVFALAFWLMFGLGVLTFACWLLDIALWATGRQIR